jgi:hypothetical protein
MSESFLASSLKRIACSSIGGNMSLLGLCISDMGCPCLIPDPGRARDRLELLPVPELLLLLAVIWRNVGSVMSELGAR